MHTPALNSHHHALAAELDPLHADKLCASHPGDGMEAGHCETPVCVLFHRFGPYHWARLQAAASRQPLLALELSADSIEYAWDNVEAKADIHRVTVFPESDSRAAPTPEVIRRVHEALDRHRPAVVTIPGWSENGGLAALAWCLKTRTPAVVMSDSSALGQKRPAWKEAVKRRVVRLFSAGLAAGTPQADYLESLGLPRERIFTGCDVVDNDYFENRSEAARCDAARLRQSLGLPESYFLGVCRFIEEKNLPTLLEAYAAYRRNAGAAAWKFVLAGDGPLKTQLLDQRARLGLSDDLLLPGFLQYRELPLYYGLASAFVLPSLSETWGLVVNEAMAAGLPVLVSNRCGCHSDLVVDGQNGFTFDPLDVDALSHRMLELTRRDLPVMGQASRRLIARWSPDAFAANLQRAVTAARAAPPPRFTALDSLLLQTLLKRRTP